MRATRVIYVENDPALRGIMTSMLSSLPDLEVMWSAGSPSEALALAPTAPADVALLDLAGGPACTRTLSYDLERSRWAIG
jgi:DNA-binding NarL/FixJ family response regulator